MSHLECPFSRATQPKCAFLRDTGALLPRSLGVQSVFDTECAALGVVVGVAVGERD